MDNQHKKIKGYRDLSQEEIDLMNKVKALGEEAGKLISELHGINAATGNDSIDMRWVAIGQTDLQKGVMALVRSVAQPTTF